MQTGDVEYVKDNEDRSKYFEDGMEFSVGSITKEGYLQLVDSNSQDYATAKANEDDILEYTDKFHTYAPTLPGSSIRLVGGHFQIVFEIRSGIDRCFPC